MLSELIAFLFVAGTLGLIFGFRLRMNFARFKFLCSERNITPTVRFLEAIRGVFRGKWKDQIAIEVKIKRVNSDDDVFSVLVNVGNPKTFEIRSSAFSWSLNLFPSISLPPSLDPQLTNFPEKTLFKFFGQDASIVENVCSNMQIQKFLLTHIKHGRDAIRLGGRQLIVLCTHSRAETSATGGNPQNLLIDMFDATVGIASIVNPRFAINVDITGAICPFCRASLNSDDDAIPCHSCGTYHHKQCWIENDGCTILGCAGSNPSVN